MKRGVAGAGTSHPMRTKSGAAANTAPGGKTHLERLSACLPGLPACQPLYLFVCLPVCLRTSVQPSRANPLPLTEDGPQGRFPLVAIL